MKVLEDEQQVKELQKNHGEWTDVMRQVSCIIKMRWVTLHN